ncbi:hypothetical protein QYF61_025683 [Mycteria americana]|uniref:Uncharacterized protein n=1 Tax=Mycteria americana TaxID=33587 RepID=A0AAN7NVW4_MYCAM|nr:hypothetical protein QYF61_025683 [Mycteria americana]
MRVVRLEQDAQKSCRCPITGTVQRQAGWSFGQPDLVKDVPARGRGVGLDIQRSLPNQTILSFYDCKAMLAAMNAYSSLEKTRLQGDLIVAFLYIKGACKKDGERLFTKACSGTTRGNGFKLKEGRFRLDIQKAFFTMRVLRHWNRLPREVMDAPSLELFKARLDGTLSNPI